MPAKPCSTPKAVSAFSASSSTRARRWCAAALPSAARSASRSATTLRRYRATRDAVSGSIVMVTPPYPLHPPGDLVDAESGLDDVRRHAPGLRQHQPAQVTLETVERLPAGPVAVVLEAVDGRAAAGPLPGGPGVGVEVDDAPRR